MISKVFKNSYTITKIITKIKRQVANWETIYCI